MQDRSQLLGGTGTYHRSSRLVAIAKICDKAPRSPGFDSRSGTAPGSCDVLEPLSDPLRKLLLELKLCSENNLRHCRRHVRRLTRSLPAFDSVWLDALVQIGRLTPYQARLLESSNRRALAIGPCVAIDRLGNGRDGVTLLARMRDGHELCVAKILRPASRLSEETIERLQSLVERVKDFAHPSIVAPISYDRVDDRLVLVSRYVPGTHLADLVIRRGRFPAQIVWEIGRQLADGL